MGSQMAECGAPFDAIIIQQRYVNETTLFLSLFFKSFCTSLAVSSYFHKVNSDSFFSPPWLSNDIGALSKNL